MLRINLILIILLLLFGLTAHTLNAQTIISNLVKAGFYPGQGSRSVDVIVVHSTFNALGGYRYNKESILRQFRMYRVSSHYLIDRQGTVFQLVKDTDIAKHAGKSSLKNGSGNINARSIGIELMNDTIDQPTDLQYTALTDLIETICTRYPVKHLVRHSDIAPDRKTDPWNTDWEGILKRLQTRGLLFF